LDGNGALGYRGRLLFNMFNIFGFGWDSFRYGLRFSINRLRRGCLLRSNRRGLGNS
jgi:hypothetical protein